MDIHQKLDQHLMMMEQNTLQLLVGRMMEIQFMDHMDTQILMVE